MPQANDCLVSALLAGNYDSDRLLVYDIFRRQGWRLYEARDRRAALECLERHPVHVVIAESAIPNWNWKKVLADLRRMSQAPQLVVTSRTADDYLWAEVLNVGGFDVLPQPLDREEVERVIAAARRHFDAQQRKAAGALTARAAAIVA
ncbi:MAG TPA: response regulator [Bryobacteraceae bacterium]|jgi:DNA-binding response OmpR family regulator|nr:response regulator [Bryobacteraceae bacterium]